MATEGKLIEVDGNRGQINRKWMATEGKLIGSQ